jgi:electron transport complex protein RnfB
VTSLAQRIDALLPQTQCTRCGYHGCRPYAQAIAAGDADINQCPPGAEPVVAQLAQLLGRAPKPLNPANGAHRAPQVAVIEEPICIGCTKCIQVCPVDAIVGASKLMHTVLASWCTGCELCIPACPVDCIVLAAAAALPEPDLSRARHDARGVRLERDLTERAARLAAYE